MKTLATKAKSTLRQKGVKPFWYFKTSCIQYGVAVINGVIWNFTISAGKNELRGRIGFPCHLAPTPKMSKGIEKARAFCRS